MNKKGRKAVATVVWGTCLVVGTMAISEGQAVLTTMSVIVGFAAMLAMASSD